MRGPTFIFIPTQQVTHMWSRERFQFEFKTLSNLHSRFIPPVAPRFVLDISCAHCSYQTWMLYKHWVLHLISCSHAVLDWMFHVLRLSKLKVVVTFCCAFERLLCLLYWSFHGLGLSNMTVPVTLRFASHRLLGALRWMFHMLRLSNMNVAVTLRFASHRLLRALCWAFRVRPSNINVVVTLAFCIPCCSYTMFCVPYIAPRGVLDVSCAVCYFVVRRSTL